MLSSLASVYWLPLGSGSCAGARKLALLNAQWVLGIRQSLAWFLPWEACGGERETGVHKPIIQGESATWAIYKVLSRDQWGSKPSSVGKLVKDSQGAVERRVDLSKVKQNLLIPLTTLRKAQIPSKCFSWAPCIAALHAAPSVRCFSYSCILFNRMSLP